MGIYICLYIFVLQANAECGICIWLYNSYSLSYSRYQKETYLQGYLPSGIIPNIYIIFLRVCLRICVRVCWFATSFLALAQNSIGVASGEPGEARETNGTANPRQMRFRQTKFHQIKFAKWIFAKWSLPNEVLPNKMFATTKNFFIIIIHTWLISSTKVFLQEKQN